MNKYLISILLFGLVGCGSSPSNDAVTAAATPAPAPVPIYDVSYFFPAGTTCQEVYPGVSGKKTTSTSSALKLFQSSDCTGTLVATLSESTVTTYTASNGVSYNLSGTNATGLTLRVLQY